ncbi:hypothetical protein Mal15_37590 [Stieleria maiorica]|uniref:Uncharacterized protein n=1 Tax=Stieleria maiorica TaxID=2795974 RepID=A0A5B9MFS9_9BACT|nr:hypothetical protein [Stieleria maiorica]QEF99693.1 hypothetical protein Mal15_37590 [Stieleria maiorica]
MTADLARPGTQGPSTHPSSTHPSSARPSSALRPRTGGAQDAKKKKQLVLVAVLLVVLLVALVFSPSGGDPSGSGSPAGGTAVPSVKTSPVSLKPLSQKDSGDKPNDLTQDFVAVDELPRLTHEQLAAVDLFRSAAVEIDEPLDESPVNDSLAEPKRPKPRAEYTLGAVYGAYDGRDRKALIDGKIVQPGEELDAGVIVLHVSPEGVEVTP